MSDTYKDARATVLELAGEAFKDHVLTPEGEDRWTCRRPGKSAYWFRIVRAPGTLILLGDVGTAVFECYGPDSFAVLTSADWHYLLSKMTALSRNAGQKEKFYAGDALAYAREAASESPESKNWRALVNEVAQLDKWGDFNEHEWHKAIEAYGLDVDDHSAGRNYSEGALWAVEAVRCFARLIKNQPEAKLAIATENER